MEIPTGEDDPSTAANPDPVPVPVPTVTIEFDLGEGVCVRSDWTIQDTVETMKKRLALDHNLSLADITISYNGEQLSDSTTVEELGPDSTGLTLIVGAPPTIPSLAVGVDEGRVRVEREVVEKPFLGGYRHKLTGVEYFNASAQTIKKLRHSGVTCYQRDTQTVLTKNKPQQVHTDAATQMNKTGCFMSTRDDKVILGTGVYETADMYHYRLLSHVMLLQRQWRAWLARRYVKGLRRDKIARELWERQEAERRAKERQDRAKRDFDRRMNPRTKEDFDLLYHALEMWRLDEMNRINQTTRGPERKAALCELLEHESQLIASIGKHKAVAGKEHKSKAIQRFLDSAAAPKRWTAFDGGLTEMDTQFTIRAQQLRDIYTSITMETVTRDERLDILLTLKCTVKEHDCKLTRELVELVDREADLLVRELDSGDSLKGLRSRIAGLFFQYCKVPLFNPEAAKHILVPQDPASLRANIYYCKSCCKYFSSTEFELSTNSRAVGRCRSCRELDNRARAREDLTLYRAMLITIRTTEQSCGDSSTVIFLMQEPDLRHLVEGIWAGQSALSAEKDLFELVLVRWNNSIQWSPWNTVCLTRDEAKAHCKLSNVYEAYGYEFVRKVHYRHVLAKSYFSSIPGMRDHMTSKVKEVPLPRPKERELTVTLKH